MIKNTIYISPFVTALRAARRLRTFILVNMISRQVIRPPSDFHKISEIMCEAKVRFLTLTQFMNHNK